MIGGATTSLFVWIGAAAAVGATAGAVLISSGPLAPDNETASLVQQDPATDTGTPQATATATPTPIEGSDATPTTGLQALADSVDTSGWQTVEDDRVPLRLKMPSQYRFRVRELPPLAIDDPGVSRFELSVSRESLDDQTPLPPHEDPDTIMVVNVTFLPPPFHEIRFGPLPSTPIDDVVVSAPAGDTYVAELAEDDFASHRVVAQANLTTNPGIFHINGTVVPASDDQLVGVLLGIVQSLEVVR